MLHFDGWLQFCTRTQAVDQHSFQCQSVRNQLGLLSFNDGNLVPKGIVVVASYVRLSVRQHVLLFLRLPSTTLSPRYFLYVIHILRIGYNVCTFRVGLRMLFHSFLTLNVRGPNYLGLTRSISWLLMPWLLTSPGHQQPWYWLYRICRFLSYLRKNFKYLCHINVEEWL